MYHIMGGVDPKWAAVTVMSSAKHLPRVNMKVIAGKGTSIMLLGYTLHATYKAEQNSLCYQAFRLTPRLFIVHFMFVIKEDKTFMF